MRNGRGDRLEISEQLEAANEEAENNMSQLCGIYVESASVVLLKGHTIWGAVP